VNGQRQKSASAWNNEIVNEQEVKSFTNNNLDLASASNSKEPEKGHREHIRTTKSLPTESIAVFWLKLTVLAISIAPLLSVED
jgi:hypothetical protein